MKVTLVDHMGSDLSVVNAARVSFNKTSSQLTERDAKLIKYLARHNHWTPFGHTCVTLHVKAPVFLARQLGKHQVGLVWNEVSRRYVDDPPEFYIPTVWRKRPDKSIKQGSGEEAVNLIGWCDYEDTCREAVHTYNTLLAAGVAPEQARMILPQSMYTEWYWTGSIAAFSRVYSLRSDHTSQREAQEIAKQIDKCIAPLFPVSWEALKNED